MPDEITITPKSETTPANAGQENQNGSVLAQLINLCAAGLGVSFFLPWARFLGGNVSGFDLQKLGGQHLLLWLIPVFCAITIVSGLTRHSQKIAGQITGVLPFCIGIYWLQRIGSDLMHILTFGAYLSLTFGAALFVLARKAKYLSTQGEYVWIF